jgi:hypothetical protein
MNTKFQIVIVILLGLILAAIVIPAAVTYWRHWKEDQAFQRTLIVPADALTPFQKRLVQEGYIRDHATHRWYHASEVIADHCLVTLIDGTAADATFICRTPLAGGIPDQESQH